MLDDDAFEEFRHFFEIDLFDLTRDFLGTQDGILNINAVSDSGFLPDLNNSSQEQTQLATTPPAELITNQQYFGGKAANNFDKEAAAEDLLNTVPTYDTAISGNGPETSESWIPANDPPTLHLQQQQPQTNALILASLFQRGTFYPQFSPPQQLGGQFEHGSGGSNYASDNQEPSLHTATRLSCQQHIRQSFLQTFEDDFIPYSTSGIPLQEGGLQAHTESGPITRDHLNLGQNNFSEIPIDGNSYPNFTFPSTASRKHNRSASPFESPHSQLGTRVEAPNPQTANAGGPFISWTQQSAMTVIDARVDKKRAKRRYGPEEKLRVAETRRGGSCLRCKAKKKKCEPSGSDGFCVDCVRAAGYSLGIAAGMCKRGPFGFARAESSKIVSILWCIPGIAEFLDFYLFNHFKAARERPDYQLNSHEADFYSYGCHYDPEEAKSCHETDSLADDHFTVLLLSGDETFSDLHKYYNCEIIEATALPSASSLVKWTDRRILKGNIFLSDDELQLLAIIRTLALHAPTGSTQATLLRHTTYFRYAGVACETKIFNLKATGRTPTHSNRDKNIMIPEQIRRVLAPALEQYEGWALTSLQEIVNSGDCKKDEMKIPLFVCISELFLVYTEVASETSGPYLRFPDLVNTYLTSHDLQAYYKRERERRESALRMCKELAGLYAFLFADFVPFGGKAQTCNPSSKTQNQWRSLDVWLKSGGVVDEGKRIEVRAMLAEYVRKMKVFADWGGQWTPGQILFGPEVFKQICDFQW